MATAPQYNPWAPTPLPQQQQPDADEVPISSIHLSHYLWIVGGDSVAYSIFSLAVENGANS